MSGLTKAILEAKPPLILPDREAAMLSICRHASVDCDTIAHIGADGKDSNWIAIQHCISEGYLIWNRCRETDLGLITWYVLTSKGRAFVRQYVGRQLVR